MTAPAGAAAWARPDVPDLEPGVCTVWWASTEDVRPGHDALLADPDLQRRSGLALVADRLRLTAAWAVARVLLGAATGTPPRRVELDRTCRDCGAGHGKPWLPAHPQLALSVAHSGSCVAVALARGCALGVDVEQVVRLAPGELDRVVESTLSAPERAELSRYADRARGFTTCWSRKEAVLKATGEGLAEPLHRLRVSAPWLPPRVIGWEGRQEHLADIALHPLHPPAGSVATLAVLGGTSLRVVEADAAPLLRALAPHDR